LAQLRVINGQPEPHSREQPVCVAAWQCDESLAVFRQIKRTHSSWNQLAEWLREIELFRRSRVAA